MAIRFAKNHTDEHEKQILEFIEKLAQNDIYKGELKKYFHMMNGVPQEIQSILDKLE